MRQLQKVANMESETRNRVSWYSYLGDLPYTPTRAMCMILDCDDGWRKIAGELRYNMVEIEHMRMAVIRPSQSPAEELFTEWSQQLPTLDTVYKKLKKLSLYRAAEVLQDYVEGRAPQRNDSESDETDCEIVTELPLPRPFQPVTQTNQLQHPAGGDGQRRPDTWQNHATSTKVLSLSHESGHPQPREDDKAIMFQQQSGFTYVNGQTSDSRNEFASNQILPSGNNGFSNGNALQASLRLSGQPSSVQKSSCLPEVTHKYHFDDICKATYGFAEALIVGRGSAGTVYKGVFTDTGHTTLAVKTFTPKSPNAELNMKMMSSEVENLLSLDHGNLVRIHGYSADGNKFCLISGYMENGSLLDLLAKKDDFLQSSPRVNILRGAAQGLHFLHHRPSPLIHGGIKSCNILIDANFEAKLSDFGQARFVGQSTEAVNGSHVNQRLVTHEYGDVSQAYLAPEIEVSAESDVYGFGVVIFECCTGEKPVDVRREGGTYLKPYIDNSCLSTVAGVRPTEDSVRYQYELLCDPFLKGTWSRDQWDQLLLLGKSCTALSKTQRPQIDQVLKQLNGIHQESADVPVPMPGQNMLNCPDSGSQAVLHMTRSNFPSQPSPNYHYARRMETFLPPQQPFSIDPRQQMLFPHEGSVGSDRTGPHMQHQLYHNIKPLQLPHNTVPSYFNTGMTAVHRPNFNNPAGFVRPESRYGISGVSDTNINQQVYPNTFGIHSDYNNRIQVYPQGTELVQNQKHLAQTNMKTLMQQERLTNHMEYVQSEREATPNLPLVQKTDETRLLLPTMPVQIQLKKNPSTQGNVGHENTPTFHPVFDGNPTVKNEDKTGAPCDGSIKDLDREGSVDSRVKTEPCEPTLDCERQIPGAPGNLNMKSDLKFKSEGDGSHGSAEIPQQHLDTATIQIENVMKSENRYTCQLGGAIHVPVMDKSFPSFVNYSSASDLFEKDESDADSDHNNRQPDQSGPPIQVYPQETELVQNLKHPAQTNMKTLMQQERPTNHMEYVQSEREATPNLPLVQKTDETGLPLPTMPVQIQLKKNPSTQGNVGHENTPTFHPVFDGNPTVKNEDKTGAPCDGSIKDLDREGSVDSRVKTEPCEPTLDCERQIPGAPGNLNMKSDLKFKSEGDGSHGSAEIPQQNLDTATIQIENVMKSENRDTCQLGGAIHVPVMEKSFTPFINYSSASDLYLPQSDVHSDTGDIHTKNWPSFMDIDSSFSMESRGFGTSSLNKSASLDFKAIKNCDRFRGDKPNKGQRKGFAIYENKYFSDPCLGPKLHVPSKCTLSGPQTCSLPICSPAIYT